MISEFLPLAFGFGRLQLWNISKNHNTKQSEGIEPEKKRLFERKKKKMKEENSCSRWRK